MNRPGADLLVSLLADERRGKPGPAREAALAALETAPPETAAMHRLDVVYASLQAGEPRRALAELDVLDSGTQNDAVERCARACRVWAMTMDYNWYPGNSGGELASGAQKAIGGPVREAPGEVETRLVEACVAHGPATLFSIRSLFASLSQSGSTPALQQIAAGAVTGLDALRVTALDIGSLSLATWALAAQADLAYRAGFVDIAVQQLADVREVLLENGDATGLACTYLVEGDWYVAPGSSVESLGFILDSESQPNTLNDAARASDAYDNAASLLENTDAPLAIGALALRRAVLAWFDNDYSTQQRWLKKARTAFLTAGDEASLRLIVVHGLLGDIAQGKVAQTMLRAGTRWDLAPRGPIAEILTWASEHGSRSFCTGLGRLLFRAGEQWRATGEFDRAEACCSLALPLVSASRGVPPASVLMVLAELDQKRELSARALVRLEQALAGFDIPSEIGDQPESWMQATQVVMGIVNAQSARTGSSGYAQGIPGLERALDRLEELARTPGLPAKEVTTQLLRDQGEILQKLKNSHQGASLDKIQSDGEGSLGNQQKLMLAISAQGVREQVSQGRCTAALNRSRQLRQQGWEAESDRWFAMALDKIRNAGPAQSYMRVLAAAQRGLDDEARAYFSEVRASGQLPDRMLAPLALRAREPAEAQVLFHKLDASADAPEKSWKDLADRAEAALETGDPEQALVLATQAIEQFECGVARLTRDPDRVSACDDISAAFLYMLATRACLAIADTRHREGKHAASQKALDNAFSFSDRGRSLPLSSLVEGRAQTSRLWQQAATEWAAAFDRLLDVYERQGGVGAESLLTVLSHADEKLAAIEAELETVGRGAPHDSRSPVDTSNLREDLPVGTCLLEYLLAGSELVVMALTRDNIAHSYVRLDRGVLEPNVNALLRACAHGAAGQEAAVLSTLLLDPVADVLRLHERVIVVPFGVLHSVPFHALPFDKQPLGETHVLSYLPAASLLRSRIVDGPLTGTGSVVVGDPEFRGRTGLRRLPGAGIEARAVARLRATKNLLVGSEATEERLRPLLPGRSVVHLAAHGRLDDVAPSTSSIVLADDDELTVSDLIGMQIDAGLAVLSACDTGRGAATLGGDLVGLGRGLLAAGIERSIVSLWPVDDIVACVTMSEFYQLLTDQTPPAHALAEAQRAVRKMSGEEIVQLYRNLGGDLDGTEIAQRRSGGVMSDLLRPRGVPLHPAFEDDCEEPEESPVENLRGDLERVWAPFVLVGV